MKDYTVVSLSSLIDELGSHFETLSGINEFYNRNIRKFDNWYKPYNEKSPLYEVLESISVVYLDKNNEPDLYPYKDNSIVGLCISEVKAVGVKIIVKTILISDDSVDDIAEVVVKSIPLTYLHLRGNEISIIIYYSLSEKANEAMLNTLEFGEYLKLVEYRRIENISYNSKKISGTYKDELKEIVSSLSKFYLEKISTEEKIHKMREKYRAKYR